MGTPEWVYNAGAEYITFSSDEVGWMPDGEDHKTAVTWDTIYLEKFFNFLEALGEKVKDWEYVYCHHLTGGGFISEMHLPRKLPETVRQWEDAGISNEVVLEAWKQIDNAYDNYMPSRSGLALAYSPTIIGVDVQYDLQEWALNKYGTRVWFQRNMLAQAFVEKNGQYAQDIFNLAEFTTVGWQTAISDRDFGDFRIAYGFAIESGASYVECYGADFEIEEYQNALQELNQGLKENYLQNSSWNIR